MPEAITLHAIGGFVLAALYGLPRPTNDLDYLSISPRDGSDSIEKLAGMGSKLARRCTVSIHAAGGVVVVDLPEGYEERLKVISLSCERLQIAMPDPYDLALSKLTRNSPRDREDVSFLARSCQLSFAPLMARFEKEMDWIPNRERHLTTLNVV